MKINLNNKVIRYLVKGADLSDGCSVIRSGIVQMGKAAFIAAMSAIMVLGLVGLTTLFFIPLHVDDDLMVILKTTLTSFYGDFWYVHLMAIGSILWSCLACMATMLACIWVIAVGIPRAHAWATNKSPRVGLIGQAITDGFMVAGGKLCPSVTILPPEPIRSIVPGKTQIEVDGAMGVVESVSAMEGDRLDHVRYRVVALVTGESTPQALDWSVVDRRWLWGRDVTILP